jgi:glycosyltransferase involved in cell wall biosynthesis
MLGWEFPPFISGGLGTACHGLTKAMSSQGVEILFVLPRPVPTDQSSHVRIVTPQLGSTSTLTEDIELPSGEFKNVRFRTVRSAISPYQTPATWKKESETSTTTVDGGTATVTTTTINQASLAPTRGFIGAGAHYGGDLFSEVDRYAKLVTHSARHEDFDVIHAHDWMTFPAGLALHHITGKPLVVHVHSTEFDRSGEHVNQRIYDIERAGMHGATHIIAVSYLTKRIVVNRYGIHEDKVSVVYNAIDSNGERHPTVAPESIHIRKDEKIVLFLGRITMQKGPEYFLAAARKVLGVMDNVRFVMAGSGDMIRRVIELAAEMGIGHKVLFTGFLRGKDV